jgi:hypothetical protein
LTGKAPYKFESISLSSAESAANSGLRPTRSISD